MLNKSRVSEVASRVLRSRDSTSEVVVNVRRGEEGKVDDGH